MRKNKEYESTELITQFILEEHDNILKFSKYRISYSLTFREYLYISYKQLLKNIKNYVKIQK